MDSRIKVFIFGVSVRRELEVVGLYLGNLRGFLAWVKLYVHFKHWLDSSVLVHLSFCGGVVVACIKDLEPVYELLNAINVDGGETFQSQKIYQISKAKESRAFFS